ncbi:MAG TPA: GNAT family N-acetyltransferase [Roseiflexaceae bacterium]|nr:GNAT family N-acetyltransferase [Roseiflexaceae bacterium]
MTILTYREVPPQEHGRFAQIQAVSYGSDYQEALEGARQGRLRRLRGLYADGRLVSVAYLYPFQIAAGGVPVPGFGIGNVATPPEDRRRGYTERLLREMCEELRAEGAALCTLGAFKNSFYGRYGWATYLELRRFSGAPALFGPFRSRQRGAWSPVGAEAIPELDAIYRGALRARFGPVVRSAEWWEQRVLWHGKQNHNYLWRDDAGAARAYVLFHFEGEWERRELHCREVVALDPEARAQIFAFFAAHEDQAKAVVFYAPADAPVQLLLPDPLECALEPGYMLRLLDVAAALSALPYPGDARGRLAIAVADDWLDHNRGVFELEVAEGTGACRKLPDGAAADLACDVRQLAQIASRHLRPRTAAAFGLLEARGRPALALLDRLFAGPAPYTSDWF